MASAVQYPAGSTPLHLAAQRGHIAILQAMLQARMHPLPGGTCQPMRTVVSCRPCHSAAAALFRPCCGHASIQHRKTLESLGFASTHTEYKTP
jgi:ankyrin repeat protein